MPFCNKQEHSSLSDNRNGCLFDIALSIFDLIVSKYSFFVLSLGVLLVISIFSCRTIEAVTSGSKNGARLNLHFDIIIRLFTRSSLSSFICATGKKGGNRPSFAHSLTSLKISVYFALYFFNTFISPAFTFTFPNRLRISCCFPLSFPIA